MINFEETELRLGLPGGGETWKNTGKRGFSETVDLKLNLSSTTVGSISEHAMGKTKEKIVKPPVKTQVVGWPPVRSSRKNIMAVQKMTDADEAEKKPGSGGGAAYVKVSMDGAPYLRKVDLKLYRSYRELSDALGKMFSSFTTGIEGSCGSQGMKDFRNEGKLIDILNGSEFVLTFEDKDGDWMLVGDVPWEMFVDSCKRLRIMKGSEAIGFAPRTVDKCKNIN